jgi:hypothetical protein
MLGLVVQGLEVRDPREFFDKADLLGHRVLASQVILVLGGHILAKLSRL